MIECYMFFVLFIRKCLIDERKRLTNLCDDWSINQSELGDIDNIEAVTVSIYL